MKAIGILAFIIGLGLTLFAAINFFATKNPVDIREVAVITYEPGYLVWLPLLGIALFGIGLVVFWQALTGNRPLQNL